MIEDDIVRDVRAAREAFAAAHGYDVAAMVAALREMDAAGGEAVVRLAPRPVPSPAAPAAPVGRTLPDRS